MENEREIMAQGGQRELSRTRRRTPRAREEKKKEIPGLLKGISHLTLLRLGNGDTSLVVSWNRVRVLGLALGPLGAPSFWPFRDPGPFGKQTKDPSTT